MKNLLATATAALLLATLAGCSMPTKRPTIPYTPVEQLLISEAIERGMEDLSLDLKSTDFSVHLRKTGLNPSHTFMAEVVEGWLGRLGFDLERDPLDADYQVRLIVDSIGTSQSIKLFGMPATSSAWLPIALPELALYKRDRSEGYARFYFDIFETETGEYITSSRDYEGKVTHTKYTIFFVFGFTRSDLPEPIERGGVGMTETDDPE